jgi:Uma2 family endonuclease
MASVRSATTGEALWRLPRVRYDEMVERGLLDSDDKVELLDGLLIAKEPQSSLHASAVLAAEAALAKAFGRGYTVRPGLPVALDDYSEPEPDLAVVRGGVWAYRREHPVKPLLMMEISMTSQRKDRLLKGGLYARAGILDYWVLNLVDEALEVYRDPVRAPSHRFGWKYRNVRLLQRGATITPLAAPRRRIRVSDLLPAS